MIDYDGKIFIAINNSEHGETPPGSIFEYHQNGDILTCTYKSTRVLYGHLIALVYDNGQLDMRYHQLNSNGILVTGICHSRPEVLPNGKIRLYEKWRWTSGDQSEGESIIEEL